MAVLRPADILSKPFLVATWVKPEKSAELAEQAGLWRRAKLGMLLHRIRSFTTVQSNSAA